MYAIPRAIVLIALFVSTAPAQDSTLVVGTVTGLDGTPLPYSTYSVSPGNIRRFTSADGNFSLYTTPGSAYRLVVKQLGYAPLDTTFVAASSRAGTQRLRVQLRGIVYRLAAVRSVAKRACTNDNDIRPELREVLEEVTKNAERELLLRDTYPFEYKLERTNQNDWLGSVGHQYVRDTVAFWSRTRDPYRLGRVLRDAPGRDGGVREMRIPQLTDFADDGFLSHHCFSYAGIQTLGREKAYEIDFEPNREVLLPDVRGSVLLDTQTLQIRRADFQLTLAGDVYPPVGTVEVTTTYHELFPGVALFQEINTAQVFTRSRPTGAVPMHTEKQRLLDVRFLGKSPKDVDSSAMRAPSAKLPVDSQGVLVARTSSPERDQRVIAAVMEEDLRNFGFYERKSRFPSGIMLNPDEVERRVKADSVDLIPEADWARIGAITHAGSITNSSNRLAISSGACPINLYVNGKPVRVPMAQIAKIRRAQISFGSELSAARIGAIELYSPGAAAPHEYPKQFSSCGLILLWTRPGLDSPNESN